jgi:hypothetical protein
MMKQREYICKIDMFEGRMQTKKWMKRFH